MENTPSDIQILRVLLGENTADCDCSAAQLAELAEHDPSVAKRVESLRALIGSMGKAAAIDHLFQVSGDRLSRLAAATLPGQHSIAAKVARVFARLVFDSHAPGVALAGFRGAGDSRSLKFDAEGVSIDLQVTVERAPVSTLVPGVVSVVGRVSSSANETSATLVAASGQAECAIESDGFFEFQVPAGEYELRIVSQSGEIVVPELRLGLE